MINIYSNLRFCTVTEEDLIKSITNIHAIGSGVGRTAEQPETIKWSDIGGLEKAKVSNRFPSVKDKIHIGNSELKFELIN
jgi:hypothetical protein